MDDDRHAEHPAAPPPGPDWGVGRYETTAARLLPVAREVVGPAAIGTGVRVVDLGYRTTDPALAWVRARIGEIAAGLADPTGST